MAEYFGALVSCAALSSLAAVLSYRMDKWYKFAVSVIVISAMLVPLSKTLKELSFSDLDDMLKPEIGEFGESAYFKAGEEGFVTGIKRLVADKYGISSDCIEVSLTGFEPTKMCAEKIKIILSGEGSTVDRHRVCDYLEGLNLGKCEVEYA